MTATNGWVGAGSRLTQASLSTLDEVMNLRDDGDKDANEFGKAEPYLWELNAVLGGCLGPACASAGCNGSRAVTEGSMTRKLHARGGSPCLVLQSSGWPSLPRRAEKDQPSSSRKTVQEIHTVEPHGNAPGKNTACWDGQTAFSTGEERGGERRGWEGGRGGSGGGGGDDVGAGAGTGAGYRSWCRSVAAQRMRDLTCLGRGWQRATGIAGDGSVRAGTRCKGDGVAATAATAAAVTLAWQWTGEGWEGGRGARKSDKGQGTDRQDRAWGNNTALTFPYDERVLAWPCPRARAGTHTHTHSLSLSLSLSLYALDDGRQRRRGEKKSAAMR
ncbi:predicted protein [Plenodomus lingam JN3]|uniref:Predicted protein n=1 Tax=Leptosphaeria maculans (strain JN3 / isolate v23.1.3 / race Av1-4-5-6-7-8) TaxID=985895 RepID=E5A8C1_LEPMJ|nr:predicted protein [Plenodomus lingam JN3]CBX99866.1 predicted protein [Plenodomus lingam JN3]